MLISENSLVVGDGGFENFEMLCNKGLTQNKTFPFLSYPGIIHLVRTQDFPGNRHFLSPDTHTYLYVSGGKKF